MKHPPFYCLNFIRCQHNTTEHQPLDCKEQCDTCINEIIDHHSKKKLVNIYLNSTVTKDLTIENSWHSHIVTVYFKSGKILYNRTVIDKSYIQEQTEIYTSENIDRIEL